jgi:hypothetical protein
MSLLEDERITVLSGIESSIAVEEGVKPSSLTWVNDTLYVFCTGGEVCMFNTKNDIPNLVRKVIHTY